MTKMKKNRVRNAKSESGYILITSYILVAGLLTATFSYFSRSFYDFDLAQRRLSRLQALYTAESGAERAIDWMKTNIPVLQPDCGQANPATETPYSNTALGSKGTYTVRITKDCKDPSRIYWIRSTGTFDGISREVRMSVRLDNFANYALASDHMDPDTYFQQSTILGDVHMNGPIQIYGAPTFLGRVSSSASEIYYYNNHTASDGYTPIGGEGSWTDDGDKEWTASRPVWDSEGGRPLLNQPRILFPPADVSSLKRRPGTQVLNQRMWIRFNGDGTFNYSNKGPITQQHPGINRFMPPKGSVMYFESVNRSAKQPQVVIRGIIDQDLTVASPQDIGIDGDLRYACYRVSADHASENVNSCRRTDPQLTVVSAKNIVHLPDAEANPAMLGQSGADLALRHRVLTGAFMALGGGMTVTDPKSVYDRLVGAADARWRVSELRIFGSLIEQEVEPKSILLGGYRSWLKLYDQKTGFELLSIHHDQRLDLSSLPLNMRTAMSILSWEAVDGTTISKPGGRFAYARPGLFDGAAAFPGEAGEGRTDSDVLPVDMTVYAVNDAPVVSEITHDAADVDPEKDGLQIAEGSVVTYHATAFDLDNTLKWSWIYQIDGGPEVEYSSGKGPVRPLVFDYWGVHPGTTYKWILRVNDRGVRVEQAMEMEVWGTSEETLTDPEVAEETMPDDDQKDAIDPQPPLLQEERSRKPVQAVEHRSSAPLKKKSVNAPKTNQLAPPRSLPALLWSLFTAGTSQLVREPVRDETQKVNSDPHQIQEQIKVPVSSQRVQRQSTAERLWFLLTEVSSAHRAAGNKKTHPSKSAPKRK